MVTLLKYSFITAVWVGLFFLSYSSLNSRSEELILQSQNTMAAAQAWESYRSTQNVDFDEQQVLQIKTVSHQNPYISWITSQTKVTDTEDFKFEIYFQPEMIYLHTLNADTWNKTDYTSSVAGELQGLKEPLAFWQRLLKHAESIDLRIGSGQDTEYIIKLKPFSDELHGIRFEDVEQAEMQLRTVKPANQLKEIYLHVDLKNNIIRGYNHITYIITFEDINAAPTITLPQEAKAAQSLKKD